MLAPTPAAASCELEPVVRLPMTAHQGLPVVVVGIGGTQVRLIVDTGASATVITAETAAAAGLRRDPNHQHQVTALGDGDAVGVWEDDLLGDVQIGPDVYRDATVHTSRLLDGQEAGNGRRIGGVLGTDILSRYDVEIDMASQALTLYHAPGCTGDYVPWRAPHRVVAAIREPGNTGRMGLPLRVMGTPVNNIIDTGAQASILTRAAALNAGLPDAALAAGDAETSLGGTGTRVDSRRVTFPYLDIAGERYAKVALTVADTSIGSIEMLLGQDWIGTRRLWLSYDNGQVFVSGP